MTGGGGGLPSSAAAAGGGSAAAGGGGVAMGGSAGGRDSPRHSKTFTSQGYVQFSPYLQSPLRLNLSNSFSFVAVNERMSGGEVSVCDGGATYTIIPALPRPDKLSSRPSPPGRGGGGGGGYDSHGDENNEDTKHSGENIE